MFLLIGAVSIQFQFIFFTSAKNLKKLSTKKLICVQSTTPRACGEKFYIVDGDYLDSILPFDTWEITRK